jgi:hypothetical protein
VRADGCRLERVVFNRKSLQRLALDPARGVKIDYLQRDLAAAQQRSEFRYPRTTPAAGLMRRLANFLPDGTRARQTVAQPACASR